MATNYTFYLNTEPGAGAATARQQRRIDNYIFVKTRGFRAAVVQPESIESRPRLIF